MNEVTHDLNHRLLQLELYVSTLRQQVAELELAAAERFDEGLEAAAVVVVFTTGEDSQLAHDILAMREDHQLAHDILSMREAVK